MNSRIHASVQLLLLYGSGKKMNYTRKWRVAMWRIESLNMVGLISVVFAVSSASADTAEYCYKYILPEIGQVGHDPIGGGDQGDVVESVTTDRDARLVIFDDGMQSRMETGTTQELTFEYSFDFEQESISLNVRANLVNAPEGLFSPEIPLQSFPLFLTHGCARVGQTQRFVTEIPDGGLDWLPAARKYEWTMTLQEFDQQFTDYYLTFDLSTQILDSAGNEISSSGPSSYEIPGRNRVFRITSE